MSLMLTLVSKTSGAALAASVSATTATGETWGYGVCTTGTPIVVEATGGVAPYTYSWTRVSGPTTVIAVSDSSYSTYFQKLMSVNSNVSAVFKCTVTDAASATVDTVNVTVTLTCNASGGGIIP